MSLYRRFVMAVQVVMPFRTLVMAVIGAALILLTVFGVDQFILYTLPAYAEIDRHLAEACLALLTVLMLLFYGLCRGVSPYANPDYLKWLESTPWTLNLPLPLCSPINLVWQDAVVVGCAMLLWWDDYVSVLYVPAFFLTLRVSLRITTNLHWTFIWGSFVPAALLLAIVPVYNNPPLVLALAVMAELVATAAIRKALERFPLTEGTWQLHNQRLRAQYEHRSEVMMGWPLVDREFSRRDRFTLATSAKLATAALFGWATFCAVYHLPFEDEEVAVGRFVVPLVALVFACVRAFIYCHGFEPPANLWVKLVKWRWIVPEYDKVFVTPLTIVAIGLVVPRGIEWATDSIKLAMSLGVMAVTFATFYLGPSLEEWRYLGHHGIGRTLVVEKHVKN